MHSALLLTLLSLLRWSPIVYLVSYLYQIQRSRDRLRSGLMNKYARIWGWVVYAVLAQIGIRCFIIRGVGMGVSDLVRKVRISSAGPASSIHRRLPKIRASPLSSRFQISSIPSLLVERLLAWEPTLVGHGPPATHGKCVWNLSSRPYSLGHAQENVKHVQGNKSDGVNFRHICHAWREAHDRLVSVVKPEGAPLDARVWKQFGGVKTMNLHGYSVSDNALRICEEGSLKHTDRARWK